MTHARRYLGVPPRGPALTLKVMNFWRMHDGKIREHWVLLDLLDLFAQTGVDLLAG
jgi:predicted ester cyclase